MPLCRAVFFDLDDTLCGYWDASKAGLREAFSAHGPAGVDPEAMVRHWAEAYRTFAKEVKTDRWYPGYLKSGEPTRTEQMRQALELAGHPSPERAAQLSEAYAAARDRHLRLFPDAWEVLTTLKARVPLGLITNGPADIQRQEVATLGIAEFFDHFYIEGEFGVGKPHPSVFESAQAAVGVPAETVWMIGNSYGHDIAPALRAGWNAIWIRRPSDVPPSAKDQSRPEERPEDSVAPTATVASLSEALAVMEGRAG